MIHPTTKTARGEQIARRLPAALAAALFAVASAPLTHAADPPDPTFAAMLLAYQYALPVYEVARVRYALEARGLPLNRLVHKRTLSGPNDRLVTGPNTDTLYSIALLDLSHGPVRVDVPDTHDRYYSISLIDAYTNDFAYIGRRTTGTKAGSYLIEGPKDSAAAPVGLPVIRAPTPQVLLLVRVLLMGPDDLDAAHKLQDGFHVTPLGPPASEPKPATPTPDDGEAFVAVVDQAMAENPPPKADAPMLARIAAVGVGPGAPPLTPALRQAWNSEFKQVEHAFLTRAKAAGAARTVNGWTSKPMAVGDFGTNYALRAVVALSGLFAGTPQENMSFVVRTDADGAPLDPHHRYRLRLPAQMPVDGFWSLSVRDLEPDGRAYIVDNPIHRYEIGDRTPGLRRNADGSLDIWIQHDPPPDDWKSNWLPIPDGPFHIAMRDYQPRPELLDGRFHFAAVQRVD